MRKFYARYNGKEFECEAENLYAAKLEAIDHFKPPRSKAHLVYVYPVSEEDGAVHFHPNDF